MKFQKLKTIKSKNAKRIIAASSFLVLAVGLFSISTRVLTGTEADAALPDGVTFTVNSTNDGSDIDNGDGICETSTPGECTLRAALGQASANSNPTFRDIIEFGIAGSGVHTISPSQSYFSGNESVLIDGYSQPGALANTSVFPNPLNGTLLIELDLSGLTTQFDTGISLTSNFALTGLIINSNPVGDTLNCYQSDNIDLYGNYFNTDYTGLVGKAGGLGTATLGLNGCSNVRVGGSLPEERNLFGTNGSGIYMYRSSPGNMDSHDISIKGNYIGVGSDGVTNLGTTSFGNINLGSATSDIAIGGPNPEDGNIIENAKSAGISATDPSDTGNTIQRVLIQNNRIVGNSDLGISIGDYAVPYNDAQNITVIGNVIFQNGIAETSTSAIDLLMPTGINYNDALDADSGANNLLNNPEYSTADVIESGGNTDITYSLDVPAGDYRIEFFSNPTPQLLDREGFEYIGYQNITSGGTGSQDFTHTLVGVGHQNITMTTTEIRSDLPFGFGATSEFGGQKPLLTDVGVEKALLNPEDVAQGATLNYGVSVVNHGPEPLNLAQHSVPLASSALFTDIMPEDIVPTNIINDGPIPGSSFIDVGNPDLTCLWAGPGSAATLFGLAGHTTYSVLACWYTGVEVELESGSSIYAEIQTEVADDSELAFINFGFSQPGQFTTDPDDPTMISQAQTGSDFLDGIYRANAGLPAQYAVNNVAAAPLPQDVDISANLTNPQDVAPGATITYDVTLTNNGITGFDLSHYFSLPQNLLQAAYPADKLSIVGAASNDINCAGLGSGSIAYWQQAGSGHPNYELLLCYYTGASQVVAPGESYVIQLQMMVNNTADFNMYFANITAFGDQDIATLQAGFFGATQDILDTFSNPNFVRVSYPVAGSNNGGGQQDGTSNNSEPKSGLSATGQTIAIITALALALIASASLLIYKKRKT